MNVKTLTLLKNMSFPRESEIHVSRHLSVVSKRLKAILSASELKRSICYQGSKFFSEFATDTNQIIPNLINNAELKRFQNVNYNQIELEFEISESIYPKGIGRDMTEANEKSNNLVLILHRNKNKWEVTTCFPGTYSLKGG
jgi:hypothetical protein